MPCRIEERQCILEGGVVNSCSRLRCEDGEEYDACVTWMGSERGMSVGHMRVHMYGLSGDSKSFME